MAEDEWAELRGVVAARVLGRSPELTKDLAEHLTAVLDDDLTRDPEIQRLLMQLAHNTIVESMGAMPDLSPPPQARTLAAAIALGRLLATHGVPACTTDQVFHVAQAWWQDAVLREFGRAQPTASPMGMLAPVMNWQLRGFLGMADAAGQEHAAVMDTWRQQSSSSLSSRVSFVLADVEVASEAEDVLHYAMSGRHLGL
ncbi:MAG: hypothetical protein Q4G46_16440, partial [Propionibacteriaceae bacterium]|nr:hypothetical protein [Propionibacteriaceae bacterium]